MSRERAKRLSGRIGEVLCNYHRSHLVRSMILPTHSRNGFTRGYAIASAKGSLCVIEMFVGCVIIHCFLSQQRISLLIFFVIWRAQYVVWLCRIPINVL